MDRQNQNLHIAVDVRKDSSIGWPAGNPDVPN